MFRYCPGIGGVIARLCDGLGDVIFTTMGCDILRLCNDVSGAIEAQYLPVCVGLLFDNLSFVLDKRCVGEFCGGARTDTTSRDMTLILGQSDTLPRDKLLEALTVSDKCTAVALVP